MSLGFSVEELLPKARGGGNLRMGLVPIPEKQWLQPNIDIEARKAAFDANPSLVTICPEADEPGRELAAMLDQPGGLAEVARTHWEDMCLLTRAPGDDVYRLVGAAIAFPTGWDHRDRMGQTMAQMHAHIHGYSEQLAEGVDNFLAGLSAGPIFGRANWFIAPTCSLRWDVEPPKLAFAHVTAENAGQTLFVRSERQTLRRLPETGAILFAIGVYITPLGGLSHGNIARIAAAVLGLPKDEGDRRGAPYYCDALLKFHERSMR